MDKMTESLVVVSKVKKYIKSTAGMNTSQETVDALTKIVHEHLDQAIKSATADKRKTVMGRDFQQTIFSTDATR